MGWFKNVMDEAAVRNYVNASNAASNMKAGPVEQARTAAGHVLGRAAGGAAIGAGINGYEYSQTGMGYGGSFSMAESVLSGAAVGAIGGGIVGGFGAKKAAMSVTANANRINKNLAKAEDRMLERGLGVAGRNTRAGLAEKVNASNRIDSDRRINTPKMIIKNKAKLQLKQGKDRLSGRLATSEMTTPVNPVNPQSDKTNYGRNTSSIRKNLSTSRKTRKDKTEQELMMQHLASGGNMADFWGL